MKPTHATDYIVHFVDGKPDCAWVYHHDGTPTLKQPHGRLHGYWVSDDGKSYKFTNNPNGELLLCPFEHLTDRIIPDTNVKVFESEEDFLITEML